MTAYYYYVCSLLNKVFCAFSFQLLGCVGEGSYLCIRFLNDWLTNNFFSPFFHFFSHHFFQKHLERIVE
jgi:hypothetical protein